MLIGENITDLQREYYKLAKKMEVNMILTSDNEIEIYEKNNAKGFRFAEAVHKLNDKCKVIDLIGMKMDVDARGNTLEGSKSLYLVDDEYYAKLMGFGQQSLI